jgi:anthranilate phosphoribosyltransferase
MKAETPTMFTPLEAINRLCDKREIFYDEMVDLMRQVMEGKVPPVQLAAILMGLHVKTESVSEIAAAAAVMREFSTKVDAAGLDHLVDTCGTGGDKAHTFNISTTAAFVSAAAGARVAKHGGRSVSSKSGSADVLEALGVNLALTPQQVALSLREVGLGFMFAPSHHPAMKHAAPVRKELGMRTILNILGPLTNPAGAPNQVMGVFHQDLVGIQARVLKMLGSRHVLTVHGEDGLDEITITGPTRVAELRHDFITEYTIEPRQFGLDTAPLEAIQVGDGAESRARVEAVLADEPGPSRDVVILNAAAALYVSGVAGSLWDGVALARDTIASGAARAKLDQLVAFTRGFAKAG